MGLLPAAAPEARAREGPAPAMVELEQRRHGSGKLGLSGIGKMSQPLLHHCTILFQDAPPRLPATVCYYPRLSWPSQAQHIPAQAFGGIRMTGNIIFDWQFLRSVPPSCRIEKYPHRRSDRGSCGCLPTPILSQNGSTGEGRQKGSSGYVHVWRFHPWRPLSYIFAAMYFHLYL